MDAAEVRKRVAEIKWWHRIDLGNGIITPGLDKTPEKLKTIGMPEDLRGKTVLDIGAWDGFFSFEAERRGAARVLAIDSCCWNGPGWGTKAGFELGRQVFNSRVEDLECEVLEISPEKIGVFDVVLFLGVLYHMRHPLLTLERVASVTRELLIVETDMDLLYCRRPAMAFYPGDELKGDPTNWWAPNSKALEAMLKDVGFRTIKPHGKRSWAYRAGRACKERIVHGSPILRSLQMNRMVFHAWK